MGIWTKKSIAELAAHTSHDQYALKRALGPWDLILMGIGAVIGAGLFSLTGIAAAENAGPAITIAFLIAAIGCTFAGLCYSELASMIPISGSAYTYAYATMGELVAWIMGWNLILEYAIGAATVSISWSAYVVSLLHDFGLHLPYELTGSPWQPVTLQNGVVGYGWINLPAMLIVIAVSYLLIIGIKKSSVFNAIIVTVKVAAVAVITVVGYFYINPENYHPFIPPNTGEFGSFGWSGVLRAAGILFFAYIGFDAVSTTAQETKMPQRNVPIGILGSLAICTVIYILFSLVLTGLVNYKDLEGAAPVAMAVAQIPFPGMSIIITIAVLSGLTSVILVMLLGQSRIFYSMSLDGLLPAVFSKIHPRFKTPWRSNIILMVAVGLFAAFAPISAAGHMASIGTLFAFVIVCAGVLILRYTQPDLPRPFRTPFFPAVPWLGIGVCIFIMGSLDQEAWYRLFGWLALGLLIYFSYSRKNVSKKNEVFRTGNS